MKMLKQLVLVLVLACFPSKVSSASCGLITSSSSGAGYFSSPTKSGSGGFTSFVPSTINTEYPNNMDCTYDINAPIGNVVKLTWETFNLKGYMPTCWPKDYVEIFVGCVSRTSIGKYCSINSQRPFDVYSPDNCLRIKFHSDDEDVGKGFVAKYTTLPKSTSYMPSSCGNILKTGTNYGTISSANWPNNYYATGGSCYWSIQVGKSKSVKIAFMDFDLPYDFGCDDVKIKIKADDDDESYSRADKTVMDSIHDTGSKVAIIVISIIIVIVVIGCVVFCYIRRRRAAQRYHQAPAAVPMAPASYPTQPAAVPPPSYGHSTAGPYPPPGSQPPPGQSPYPPPGQSPYPPPGQSPYPPPGQSPYPPPGQSPYPPPGQSPYPPPGGQPYPPPGGQPYPPPGGQPYPPQGAPPPYPPPGQGQPYPPPDQEKPYPPM